MKKVLALGILASLTLSAFGQGTVVFNNKVSTTTAGVNPNTISAVISDAVTGLALNGTDTTYRAALLGGATTGTAWTTTTAGTLSLLASPSTAVSWVGFRTGAAAGFVNVGTDVSRDSKLPYGSTGLFQVVAWQGNYTTWQDAWTAAQNGAVKIGMSSALTLPVTTSATDLNVPNLQGLSSFSINYVPEPSSMALAGVGAAALLIFRRRK